MDIRNCNIKYQCPKQWLALEETVDPAIRHCEQCKQSVHLCADEHELMVAMQKDWCVAIPIRPVDSDDTEIMMGDIDWTDGKPESSIEIGNPAIISIEDESTSDPLGVFDGQDHKEIGE